MIGTVRQRLAGRLGDAEVDNLGNRLVVVECDQHVRRLDIAVDDAFLVSVLNRLAHGHEQFQPLPGSELAGIAELRDGNAFHQFHDEERRTRLRHTAIENLGDVRMIHHGERLPFRFETRKHRLGVHAGLDQFHRHEALHRFRLLGAPDAAHAPFSDQFDQLVFVRDDGAEFFARQIGRGVRIDRTLMRECGLIDSRGGNGFQETAEVFVFVEQRLDPFVQRPVAAARLFEKGDSCGIAHVQCGHEQFALGHRWLQGRSLRLQLSMRETGAKSAKNSVLLAGRASDGQDEQNRRLRVRLTMHQLPIFWRSHERAYAQTLWAERTDISIAAATSSIVIPLKKRSLTSVAASGSIRASSSRAS